MTSEIGRFPSVWTSLVVFERKRKRRRAAVGVESDEQMVIQESLGKANNSENPAMKNAMCIAPMAIHICQNQVQK